MLQASFVTPALSGGASFRMPSALGTSSFCLSAAIRSSSPRPPIGRQCCEWWHGQENLSQAVLLCLAKSALFFQNHAMRSFMALCRPFVYMEVHVSASLHVRSVVALAVLLFCHHCSFPHALPTLFPVARACAASLLAPLVLERPLACAACMLTVNATGYRAVFNCSSCTQWILPDFMQYLEAHLAGVMPTKAR